MNKLELIGKTEQLMSQGLTAESSKEIKSLLKAYSELYALEMEHAKQVHREEGGNIREFEFAKTADDLKMEANKDKFTKALKDLEQKLEEDHKKNANHKREIIAQINELGKLDIKPSAAITKLKELNTKWKEAGSVNSSIYRDLQAEYSKAVENFNYQISMVFQFQDYDYKVNYDLKSELITKVNGLTALNNMKEIERALRQFRNEWEEIGPVSKEKWDEVKVSYQAAVNAAYDKIKAIRLTLEAKAGDVLASKHALIQKIKSVDFSQCNDEKTWEKKTDELTALREEWKTLGRSDSEEGEKVFGEFKEALDLFYKAKREFYEALRSKQSGWKEAKLKLIADAIKVAEGTDFASASKKLIQLQNSWKESGRLSYHDEQKLFTKFRKICNDFFEGQRKHIDAQNATLVSNIAVKEEMLAKLEAFTFSGDLITDKNALKQFGNDWNNAGHVPMSDKKRLNDTFYAKLDSLFEKLNIDKKEMALMNFNSKLERLVGGDGPEFALRKEIDFLRKQADEHVRKIANYETNLGSFKFAKSKGPNPFTAQIENEIAHEKERLEEIKNKIKLAREFSEKLSPSN